MPVRDMLGNRMKEYERRNQYWLQKRTPVCIRVDMRAGHTFTKGFKRPFDEIFMKTIQQTAKYMCENIEGAVLSYQQSDEITIILQDYKKLNTEAWFDYRTDKLCSISASMATVAFNKYFSDNVVEFILSEDAKEGIKKGLPKAPYIIDSFYSLADNEKDYVQTLLKAVEKGAMFDARCFNIPKEEVTNLLYWRQLDAARNSGQMIGQAYLSHKELQNKYCGDIHDMLL